MGRLIEVVVVLSAIFIIDGIRAASTPKIGYNIINANSMECKADDPTFSRILKCELKPINRTTKLISIKGVLLQTLNEGTVIINILKRANGYKPFAFITTMNFCQFLGGKGNFAIDWLYKVVMPYWNLNHSCPYEGELQLEKLPFNKIVLPSIFPDGVYKYIARLVVKNIPRITFSAAFTVQEKETIYH